MFRSLSGRLLVGIVSLVVLGLAIADLATYTLLQSSLLGHVDDQLKSGHDAAVSGLGGDVEPNGRGPTSPFPTGTGVQLVAPDGTVLETRWSVPFNSPTTPGWKPVLPKPLPSAGTDRPVAPYTTAGTGGVDEFRVTDWPENFFQGNYVVLAIPLTDVESTLHQLLVLELELGAVVVVLTGLLAWGIIRIGLRPLDRMRTVAQEIAAGDLSRRVEPATRHTEIGRLGLALNGMLSQIEKAFARQAASENTLRRFIADASHELRTPLTSVRGYAEMLRRGAEKSPEDSAVARRRIEEESVRMSEMVDDMLVLARLGQGRPLEREPVDLQAIARDTVADARVVAPQREITLDAPVPVVITGDDARLRQALGNLVRNALVHTPPDTPVHVRVASDNGTAHLTVVDHGPGLGPEERGRVFEPFYRADPSRSRDSGGAGLGLSIVAAVAGAHGGAVAVSDTPGGGATFDIELPARTAEK